MVQLIDNFGEFVAWLVGIVASVAIFTAVVDFWTQTTLATNPTLFFAVVTTGILSVITYGLSRVLEDGIAETFFYGVGTTHITLTVVYPILAIFTGQMQVGAQIGLLGWAILALAASVIVRGMVEGGVRAAVPGTGDY